MSKLKPSWYQLVNLDGEIGCIAYNASAKLYRKWLPNKAISLSKYLTELGENNIHVATVTPADYNKLPTEAEYNREDKKEDEDGVKPVTDEIRISPNQSERAGTVNRVVLHNTASSYESAVSWLCNPTAQASAHLVIGRDGKVCRMVDDNFAAWHAGNRTVNHQSIGIEIVATNEERGMTAAQEAQVIAWVKHFAGKYNIKADNIVGHRTIVNTSCPVLIWETEADLRSWVNAKIAGKKEDDKKETPITGVLKYARDKDLQITANFNTSELQCKCGVCDVQLLDAELVNKLQALRDRIGQPITVTSCYRCPAHNTKIGGAVNSYHTKGLAADIYVDGMTVEQLAKHAVMVGFTGIGSYYRSGFVHVSVKSNEGDFVGD